MNSLKGTKTEKNVLTALPENHRQETVTRILPQRQKRKNMNRFVEYS